MSSNCSFDPTLRAITIPVAAISALLSFIVIIIYFMVPNLRKNANIRYTIYIISSVLINNIFSALYVIIWDPNFPFYMLIMSSIAYLGLYSSIIWCILFVWNLHQIIVKNIMNFTKNESYHVFFTYGISFTVIVINTLLELSSNDECAPIFLFSKEHVIESIIFGYIPEFGMIIIVISLYVKIIIASKTTLGCVNYGTFIKQIILFPICVVVLIGIIIVQQFLYEQNSALYGTIFVLGFLKQLIGIVNAILYGYNSAVRDEIKYYCRNRRNSRNGLLITNSSRADSLQ